MAMEHFKSGVNFGCWISQYGALDFDRFRSQINRDDVNRVRDWGLDHIRLPFDYPALLDEHNGYAVKPEGQAILDDMVSWAREAGLGLLLDMHWAPGYRFGDKGSNTLFETSEKQDLFVKIWEDLAKRYQGEGELLAFDLLNEVAESEYLEPWTALALRTIRALRAISPERDIIYGGANYNSVHMLDQLVVLDDPHVVYNFHYYEPFLFTHQHATWSEMALRYDVVQEYPAPYGRPLKPFLMELEGTDHSYNQDYYAPFDCDKAVLLRDLSKARDFMTRTGKQVYCGEYGVYDKAPKESADRWVQDVTDICNEYKIGRAIWNYREGGFGQWDWRNGKPARPDQIKIISKMF